MDIDYKNNGGDLICLDKNESPYNLPAKIREEISLKILNTKFNRYPDFNSENVISKIANFEKLQPENINIGNGSDELLDLIILNTKGKVIINTPTFGMYEFFAKKHGKQLKKIPLNENFQFQINKKDINSKDDLVIICSPNNPTGTEIQEDRLIEILDTGVNVLLDEAYYSFSDKDYKFLIKEYNNLIITRTFSKAFGLAAIRAGYSISSIKYSLEIRKLVSPFSLNKLSEIVIEKILENYEEIEKSTEEIKKNRDRIYANFKKYSIESKTNFVLLKFEDADFVYNQLFSEGIVTRKYNEELEQFIRVTVGNEYETKTFIKALSNILKKL
ncbi:histidinol-phosphate transaminase [Geotoga petraea]|jgi:histidinol-phosphate aminotransferase|uniref:Histidinol-phosphate transaminase n=1 Tax=Geotoga petraea TaxID=28234 RepID=A0A4Z0W4I4_9BACT|nr:histidinol-phosphate transaminase [Geotoga petraea]TGG87924.1 histidinol-phosphate transaminase [Geotoga petraea]